jgi:hypothetical protein
MVKERLRAWRKANEGRLPANMLFYRDGISESQFAECKAVEIKAIQKAYKYLADSEYLKESKLTLENHMEKFRLTFVICGKRHHTRFYAATEQQTYRESLKIGQNVLPNEINGNLEPGLLVTKVITNPTPFNFFLQSHRVIKGTARSAHYHVLQDDMKIGNHNPPRLTMMLCYAFGRATTGVSYVSPAYIADRLCERGRIYLREWNMNPGMRPIFQMPSNEDEDGNRKPVTKEYMDLAKKEFAKTISNDKNIWGKKYGTQYEGAVWENPWSPDLGLPQETESNGMFWM